MCFKNWRKKKEAKMKQQEMEASKVVDNTEKKVETAPVEVGNSVKEESVVVEKEKVEIEKETSVKKTAPVKKETSVKKDALVKNVNAEKKEEVAKKENSKKTSPAKVTAKKETAVKKAPTAEAKEDSVSKIKNNYHVSQNKSKDHEREGEWRVRKEGSDKTIKFFNTQAEAIEFAKGLAENNDGNVIIHKKDGKIRKTSY